MSTQTYGSIQNMMKCLFEVEEGIIETQVERAHTEKVQMELRALREHIQDRDVIADQMAAASQEDQAMAQNTPIL
jgi:regulator of sigma D